MVVQHNLTAMNSNRMLNLTVKSQADSTEKLSSGYRINRAADDAAGLSISEKMRKQIRGLTQASSNAQDGISAVQTAEGALNEVQDMLQRMNELAVKAANGTNSSDDRNYIQNEIDQLVSEVSRVSETTKFNETYLLKGDSESTKAWEYGFKEDTTNPATVGDASYTADSAKLIATGSIGAGVTTATTKYVYFDGTDFVDLNSGTTATKYTDEKLGFTDGDKNNFSKGDVIKVDMTSDGTNAKSVTYTVYEADEYGMKLYDKNGNRIAHNQLENYFTAADPTTAGGSATLTMNTGVELYLDEKQEIKLDASTTGVSADGISDLISDNLTAARNITGDLELKLHVGADATSNNQISLSLTALTAQGLGIDGLDVSGDDDTNALYSINVISEAIQKISTQRSALGAIQNRLDHTINNLDNVVENTTSAESSIRDTDMATEMVTYSNNNILAQAGQAMLAQSNQANQGVLSLLQ